MVFGNLYLDLLLSRLVIPDRQGGQNNVAPKNEPEDLSDDSILPVVVPQNSGPSPSQFLYHRV